MKLYYSTSVKDGQLIIPKSMLREVPQLYGDKPIKITVERNKVRRSNPQNAYYWGVILPHVRDGFIDIGNVIPRTSEGVQMIHELMREKFIDNGLAIADNHGQVHTLRNSTTRLTKDEFSYYIKQIKEWSAEFLNITIPEDETT